MRSLLAAALGVLLVVQPATAAGIGWKSSDITVRTNVLGTPLEPYFRTAIAQWDASPYITLTVEPTRSCKAQRGVVVLCAIDGSNQWTELDYQRGYIVRTYGQVPTLQADAFTGFVCHEIGHAIGLFHTADHDSCMYSWEMDGIGGEQATHPAASDYDALAEIYG